MKATSVTKRYFDWLCQLVRGEEDETGPSYQTLLRFLHDTEFTYILDMDVNRAQDGTDLRYTFGYWNGLQDETVKRYLDNKPCSVLEMMVALAVRCEGFMSNTELGDRTGLWFWNMIANLGLASMTDQQFDREEADGIVDRFLSRNYEPDGIGGLFTVHDTIFDLRTVEIWHQAMWYLNKYTTS